MSNLLSLNIELSKEIIKLKKEIIELKKSKTKGEKTISIKPDKTFKHSFNFYKPVKTSKGLFVGIEQLL